MPKSLLDQLINETIKTNDWCGKGYETQKDLMKIEQMVDADPKTAGAQINFQRPATLDSRFIHETPVQLEASNILDATMRRYQFLILNNVILPENILPHRYSKSKIKPEGFSTIAVSSVHRGTWKDLQIPENLPLTARVSPENIPLGFHSDRWPYTLCYSPPLHTRPHGTTTACRYRAAGIAPGQLHGNKTLIEWQIENTPQEVQHTCNWSTKAGKILIINNHDRKIDHAAPGGRDDLIIIPVHRSELEENPNNIIPGNNQ